MNTRTHARAFRLGLGGALFALAICHIGNAQTADGNLGPELRTLIADGNNNGIPDILELPGGGIRPGIIKRYVDNDVNGGLFVGADGFRDAAIADVVPAAAFPCRDRVAPPPGGNLRVRSPINHGKVTLIYLMDSDGIVEPPDQDDSLLYVGIDIVNGDPYVVTGTGQFAGQSLAVDFELPGGTTLCDYGLPVSGPGSNTFCNFMVPFDADGDGNPVTQRRGDFDCNGTVDFNFNLSENAPKDYRIEIIPCSSGCDVAGGFPCQRSKNCEGFLSLSLGLTSSGSPVVLTESFFGAPPTPPSFTYFAFPAPGTTANQLFLRGLDAFNGVPTAVNTLDVEFIIPRIDTIVDQKFPLTPYSTDRFRLTRGRLDVFSDADGDNSEEDISCTRWVIGLPEIEARKLVKCDGENDNLFRESTSALPNSVVEFLLDVENTGNLDLDTTLTDTIARICADTNLDIIATGAITAGANGVADTTAVGDDVQVYPVGTTGLTPNTVVVSPGPNGVLNTAAAADDVLDSSPMDVTLFEDGQPPRVLNFVVVQANPTLRINPNFFGPANNAFLNSARAGTPLRFGFLDGIDVCLDRDMGDRVEIRFKAVVTATNNLCQNCTGPIDVTNSIRASGAFDLDGVPGNGDEGTVVDAPAVIDTNRERMMNEDDNVVDINVLCQALEFTKEVCLLEGPNPVSCTTGDTPLNLPPIAPGVPLTIAYRYTARNTGESIQTVTITDPFLCQDVASAAGVDFDPSCELCQAGGAVRVLQPANPGSTDEAVIICRVTFASQAALDAFLMLDDNRAECRATLPGPPVIGDPDCYRNCASASGQSGGGDVCGRGSITRDSFATICQRPCRIGINKQVRCVDDCANVNGLGSGFVDEQRALPGSCVQFKVEITNNPPDDEVIDNAPPVCRLRIIDSLCGQLPAPAFPADFGNCEPGTVTACVPLPDPARPCIEVIPGTVRFVVVLADGVTTVPVATPAGFNVNGVPFEWRPCEDPSFQGGRPLRDQETLRITYGARVPDDANRDCMAVNNVLAQCSGCRPDGTCPLPGDASVYDDFVCADAKVDVLVPGIACTKTYTEFAWDQNANCLTDDAFQPFVNPCTDLQDKIFPIQVRFRICAQNTGEVRLDIGASDTDFINDIIAAPGVDLIACNPPLATRQFANPGQEVCWECTVQFNTADAARAFATRDDGRPCANPRGCPANPIGRCYKNCATVSGTLVLVGGGDRVNQPRDGGDLSVLNADGAGGDELVGPGVICGVLPPVTSQCVAELCFPEPCNIQVNKQVKCVEDPDAAYGASAMALPGSSVRFRIRTANNGPVPIPRLCITDTLGCTTWVRSNFVARIINTASGAVVVADASACFPNFLNTIGNPGTRTCYTFGCLPNPPGHGKFLLPGETLELFFDARVPADFDAACGTNPDCTNTVTVQAFSETCTPEGTPCGTGTSSANVDVEIPRLACEKRVGASGNLGDGTPYTRPPVADLTVPCNTAFPFTLTYEFEARNVGEVAFTNVQVCDDTLIQRALAAGLIVGSCDLCTGACDGTNDTCATIGNLAAPVNCGPAVTAIRRCTLTVPNLAAWTLFANSDGGPTGDGCYNNTARVTGTVDVTGLCDSGAELARQSTCSARACLNPCSLSVIKEVRCLPNCIEPADEEAGWVNVDCNPDPSTYLDVAPGSCIQYRIRIENNGNGPVCAVEVTDTMADANQFASGPSDIRVRRGATNIAGQMNPPFNIVGTPSVITFPTAQPLNPGERVRILFRMVVRSHDDPVLDPNVSPCNLVRVRCACECPAGQPPAFGEFFQNDEPIDILTASLTCESKRWTFKADNDADCQPDGNFITRACAPPDPECLDLSGEIFPVCLRLEITARNTGEVPLSIVASDPALSACVASVPGVSFVNASCVAPPGAANELGTAKLVAPGATAVWTAFIRIDTAAAARALDACDGVTDGVYNNTASVSGTMTAGGGNICVPPNVTIPGADTCSARILVPPPCDLSVTKQVVCIDCATGAEIGAPADPLEVVAGGCVRYTITVTNDSPTIRLPRISLDDMTNCGGTFGNVRAMLAGVDVTADFTGPTGFRPDGVRRFFRFASRVGAPWIAPGEQLVLTFDVTLPVVGARDCSNTIVVEGFSEVCVPPGQTDARCDLDQATVNLDVKIPRIECDKNVEDSGVFPRTLTFTFTVTNTGEIPLADVRVCDDNLVAHAIAAGGIVVGPCDLCDDPACDGTSDTCFTFPGILGPGDSVSATCVLSDIDEDEWERFSQLDGDTPENCYLNTANVFGTADLTGSGLCGPTEPPTVSNSCSAEVCINTDLRCPPIVKAQFAIWNQNEIRFSGTERCIESWDTFKLEDTTGESGLRNHLRLEFLQTDKGKARIDGQRSTVCPPERPDDPWLNAPFLGVSWRLMEFGATMAQEIAGAHLVGVGEQAGQINYLNEPPGVPTPAVGPGGRSSMSQVGSLLVWPLVEIKWDSAGDLIQDTYIELSNDSPDSVGVQLVFVNMSPDGPECNYLDNLITLTGDEPAYWSVLTGLPKGVSPFTTLDASDPLGVPDPDTMRNPGGRHMYGYIIGWAVDLDEREIRWNNLKGDAILLNYQETSAWEYGAWAFQAVAGQTDGNLLLNPLGQLDLDGFEYQTAPNLLVLDFFSAGSMPFGRPGEDVELRTYLTLWAAYKNFAP
ncbi:MAG: hypothetical protein AB7Q17_02025 [Phycisphaerae bacterium]